MFRIAMLSVIVATLSCVGPVRLVAAQQPVRLAQAGGPEQTEQRVLPEGAAAAASDLDVTADCSSIQPGEAVATFRWIPVPVLDRQQRVDVTKFREGFDRKTFQTIAALPAAQASVEWRGGEAGINYYWRVLTLTREGWVPSVVARFEAPICPVDFEESESAPE